MASSVSNSAIRRRSSSVTGDAVEASVQQGSRFVAGHGAVATEGAAGIAGNTAVGLNQISQSLVSPVGGVDVGELGDAGTRSAEAA